MTPPRAEIVIFCGATLVIVGGAVGLLFYNGRAPMLIAANGLSVIGTLCLVWLLRVRSRP
jgi:hypothetical protein